VFFVDLVEATGWSRIGARKAPTAPSIPPDHEPLAAETLEVGPLHGALFQLLQLSKVHRFPLLLAGPNLTTLATLIIAKKKRSLGRYRRSLGSWPV